MRKIAFALTFVFLQLATAKSEPPPISAIYMKKLTDSIGEMQSLKDQLATSSEKICPGVVKGSQTVCLKRYLENYKPQSSTEITLMAAVVVGTVLSDKQKYPKSGEQRKIDVATMILSVLDAIDVSNFYLSQLPATSPTDKSELSQLKKDDEQLLAAAVTKILSVVDKDLSDELSRRSPTSLETVESTEIKKLRAKIELMRKKKFSYK